MIRLTKSVRLVVYDDEDCVIRRLPAGTVLDLEQMDVEAIEVGGLGEGSFEWVPDQDEP